MWTTKEGLEALKRKAEAYVINNDRILYVPVLRAIEEFAATHGMIIGGRIAEHALLGLSRESKEAELWVLELYSSNLVEDVNACVETVYRALKHESYLGDARTLTLKTVMEKKEYQILADYRIVAVCKSLGERRGINIINIISPVIKKGLFSGENVQIMPRNLQIMRILHLLCMPGTNAAIAKQWKDLIVRLDQLWDDAREPIDGGDAQFEDAHIAHWDNLDSEGILIGEIAANYYLGKRNSGNSGRAQYLCSFDGFDEYAEHSGINKTFNDLRVPDDFRLFKYILKSSDGEKFIADIFNAPDYELIPYVIASDGRKFASPFCVLRFLFVDMWSLDFVAKLTANAGNAVQPLIVRKNKLYSIARELYAWITKCEDIAVLFPPTYAGTYISESDTKRMRGSKVKSGAPKIAYAAPEKDMVALADELVKKFMAL